MGGVLDSYKHIAKVKKRFQNWLGRLPVLGFNSSFYDIPILRETLFHELGLPEEKRPFVIKKGGGYVSICTERFNFLDVKNFIGPGVNYDKFVRTYNGPDVDGKGA